MPDVVGVTLWLPLTILFPFQDPDPDEIGGSAMQLTPDPVVVHVRVVGEPR